MGIFDKLFGPPNVEELRSKRNVRGLIKALKYHGFNQTTVRKEAAKALGAIGDKRAVEPLIWILSERLMDVVEEAVLKALSKIGDERAVEPIIQALVDGKTSNLRKGAAEALGNLGNSRALDSLIQALKYEDWEVREKAVEALGKIRDKRADVRAAIEGLIQVQGDKERCPARMFSTMVNIRWGARKTLTEIGKPAVKLLIRALEDEEWAVREGAAWSLGEIGDERAVNPLVHALSDEKSEVREKGVEALGKIRDKRAVEPLSHALSDEDWEVREKAVEALGKIRDKRAVEPLSHALSDEKWGVRRKAAETLGKIGNLRTVEEVINTLFDRAYDIASTWSLEENVRKRQNEWKNKFRNLFADYTDLIIDATLFEVRHKHTMDGRYYEYHVYSLNNTEDATKGLCKIYTPISNNILHIIAKRRDIEVRSGQTGPGTFSQQTLSFKLLREIAKKELERRGNPPYDSSAYLDEKRWKL